VSELPTRKRFLKRALELAGTPYIWGGRSKAGVDCWGLVAVAYSEAGGADRSAWWTDVAWNTLPEVEPWSRKPGDLAFYGGRNPKDVDHVMIILWDDMLLGACGGGSRIKTPEDALAANARVKVAEDATAYNHARGTDLRGFRRLPFKGE
jgi:cell wall-associated NlpC family hydrolase